MPAVAKAARLFLGDGGIGNRKVKVMKTRGSISKARTQNPYRSENDGEINLELSLSTFSSVDLAASAPSFLKLQQQQPTAGVLPERPQPRYAVPAAICGGGESAREESPRTRARRNPNLQVRRGGKSEVVGPPYPWATNRRARVHSINRLLANNIHTITGDVQCKKCDKVYVMEYDLLKEFRRIGAFVMENRIAMCDRAPALWGNPILPSCKFCGEENCVKPVMSAKKREINWLFLFLGTLLGCCTLEQLKYFCKHTRNHRTGAKDRVLYLAYIEMCRQLDPHGPF